MKVQKMKVEVEITEPEVLSMTEDLTNALFGMLEHVAKKNNRKLADHHGIDIAIVATIVADASTMLIKLTSENPIRQDAIFEAWKNDLQESYDSYPRYNIEEVKK